jgi:hypothetical protein
MPKYEAKLLVTYTRYVDVEFDAEDDLDALIFFDLHATNDDRVTILGESNLEESEESPELLAFRRKEES